MTANESRTDPLARCPCLSGETYGSCCGRFHSGEAWAPTAQYLMRSRYSAFAVGAVDYLLQTWHPATRPRTLRLDPAQQWVRLDIVKLVNGGLFDTEGTVEFRAYCRVGGIRHVQHELSTFVREQGRWVYRDGLSLD